MVRLKTRWMLVSLEFFPPTDTSSSMTLMFPTRKDFANSLRESIVSCFGTAASDAAMDLQVRLCDAKSGLVLFRVSRGNAAKVRASLTMLTTLPVSPATDNDNSGVDNPTSTSRRIRRVTASVVSVHGTIRTAKLHTMRQLRQRHQKQQQQFQQEGKKEKAKKERELQECLVRIQTME